MDKSSPTPLSQESKRKRAERMDAISGAFLAFAAMMKEDYGISKEVAVLAIAAAYDTNAEKE